MEICVLLLRHDDRNAACPMAKAAEMECDTGIAGGLARERLEEGPGVKRTVLQRLIGLTISSEETAGAVFFVQRFPDLDRGALALEHDRGRWPKADVSTQRARDSTDAKPGPEIFVQAFEPGGRVHSVTGCRVVVAPARTEIADHGG